MPQEKRKDADGNADKENKRPKQDVLPEVIVPELKGDRVFYFRQTYRGFRTGKAFGAKGEPAQFNTEEQMPPINDEVIEDDTFFTVNGSQKVYDAITNFRVSYTKFRQGSNQGAKGEVSAITHLMTTQHAKLMPVAGRSNMLKGLKEIKVERPKSRFHVHFGAGKLGMGLLSGVIANAQDETPFAIVDAPFGDYDALIKRSETHVNFFVNGKPTLQNVKLVRNAEELPKNLLEKGMRIFICTHDNDLVRSVVKQADTLSTALGPVLHKVIPMHMEHPDLNIIDSKVKTIYCCENDHGMVEDLGERLKGRAEVVVCMVDRICPGRDVEGPNIKVTAEPHNGEIVILNPPAGVPLPAFKGDNVIVPGSYGEADYFCRRKINIVNGMHTTLAFMTLCKEDKGDHPGDHPLMTVDSAPEDLKDQIWAWAVARVLLVMYEHDIEVIKHAHGVEKDDEAIKILLDYAKTVLNRFNSIKDTTGRVLGGGVANRWNGRLKNCLNFLESQGKFGGLQGKVLKMAKVDGNTLKQNVKKLVDDSERFTGWTGAPSNE